MGNWKVTRSWILAGITALSILFVLNAIFPVIITHNKCYEKIAKIECDDKDAYVGHLAPFFETTFSCCQNATKETRKWVDNRINCESYVFFEEDHQKCSNKYYLLGLKVVD